MYKYTDLPSEAYTALDWGQDIHKLRDATVLAASHDADALKADECLDAI